MKAGMIKSHLNWVYYTKLCCRIVLVYWHRDINVVFCFQKANMKRGKSSLL